MATALVDQAPVTPVSAPPQRVAPNADVDARWAAWLQRGREHDERVRRRLLIWGPVIAVAVAIALAVFGT